MNEPLDLIDKRRGERRTRTEAVSADRRVLLRRSQDTAPSDRCPHCGQSPRKLRARSERMQTAIDRVLAGETAYRVAKDLGMQYSQLWVALRAIRRQQSVP